MHQHAQHARRLAASRCRICSTRLLPHLVVGRIAVEELRLAAQRANLLLQSPRRAAACRARSRWTPKMFMPARASSSAVASPNPLLAPRIRAQGCLLMAVVTSISLSSSSERADADLGALRRQQLAESARPTRSAPARRGRTARPGRASPPRAARPAGTDRCDTRRPCAVLVDQREGGARDLVGRRRAAARRTMPLASVVFPAPRLPISSTTPRARQLARQPLAQRDGLLLRGGAIACGTLPPWRCGQILAAGRWRSGTSRPAPARRSRRPGRAGRPRRPRPGPARRETAPASPAIMPVRMSPVPPVPIAGVPVGIDPDAAVGEGDHACAGL